MMIEYIKSNRIPAFKALVLAALLLVCAFIGIGKYVKTPAVYNSLESQVMRFAGRYPNRDSIFISKSAHYIYYCDKGLIVRNVKWDGYDLTFPAPIAIGMGGRYETPAGEYYICQKNANSKYTRFLGLSWPNISDLNRAIELGYKISVNDRKRIITANALRLQPPWDTPMGGTYGIHGAPTYLKYAIDRMEKADPNLIQVTKRDNTKGCVAVEHRYLNFFFANVKEGTPVLIAN